MPMGFYQPAQIIIDARKHGVDVRPVDVNYSLWDNQMEEASGKYWAVRLGFRQVKGLREDDMSLLVVARPEAGFSSIQEIRNTGLSDAVLERLADADAFRSVGYDRRHALWKVSAKDHQAKALFSHHAAASDEENIALPEMTLSQHVVQDYASTTLSLKAHPVSFVREQLSQLHVRSASQLDSAKNGDRVKAAGLILVRQRPGTASGICFITLEDETGTANLVVFRDLFDKYRKEIIQSRLLMVDGTLQREGEVIHVIVKRCYNLSGLLRQLDADSAEQVSFPTGSRADETTSPFLPKDGTEKRDVVQGNIFGEGRNFR